MTNFRLIQFKSICTYKFKCSKNWGNIQFKILLALAVDHFLKDLWKSNSSIGGPSIEILIKESRDLTDIQLRKQLLIIFCFENHLSHSTVETKIYTGDIKVVCIQ